MRRNQTQSRFAVLAGAIACVVAALAVGLSVLGVAHMLVIVAVILGLGVVSAAGCRWVLAARRHGRAPSLGRQFAIVVGLVVAPLLLSLVILGLAMFVSGHDAVLVGVIVALGGVLGIAAAAALVEDLSAEVGAIRDGLVAVARGDREVRLEAHSAPELTELAAQAEAMISALAHEEAARTSSEEARRQLVAHASHDLRTPVTSLRLLAAAIDDDVVDGELRREYVGRMLTHIEALSGLIDDLFELSRIQAGDVSWALEQIALEELLTDTVAAMETQAAARGVLVRTDLPGSLAPAWANSEKVQRVLFNLVQNAIRHSPPDGTVTVRAEARAEMIEIEVEDTGEGIPDAARDLVFDAFYRAEESGGRPDGRAGLGLAVARAIVDAHGGEIWLPSVDSGARVRFSLPAAAAGRARSAAAQGESK